MSVISKIEKLLEQDMIRDPEDPTTFASAEERARIAKAHADYLKQQSDAAKGLDMTGDPEDPTMFADEAKRAAIDAASKYFGD